MSKTQLTFFLEFLVCLRRLEMHISREEQTRCFECAREEELTSDCWGPVETMEKGCLGWVLKDDENLGRQRRAEGFTGRRRSVIEIREEGKTI